MIASVAHNDPHAARTPPPVRVIAVASGKGGVGKTTVSVNLALALQQAGRRTLLLDADLGLANVDVQLGLKPRHDLSHVLDGKCTLAETILRGPMGLQVVPAASGIARMAQLSLQEHIGLIRAFSDLEQPIDVLVIDTAAGIAGDVVTFTQAAQELIVVICNEPTSVANAYALLRVLAQNYGVRRAHVLANMAHTPEEGRESFERLQRHAEALPEMHLDFLGAIPYDDTVRQCIKVQTPVLEAYPAGPTATMFRWLARRTEQWAPPTGARGNLEFFVERLVGTAQKVGHA